MILNDRDWQLVSAYADGELDSDARLAVERRLASEPDLCAALDRIRRSKSALARMRPPAGVPEATSGRRGRSVAIAASILVAFAVSAGAYWFTLPGGKAGHELAADWHADFAEKSYVIERNGAITLAAGAALGFSEAPDLSASNLVLVDIQLGRQPDAASVAMHYRGPNGCRLTLVAQSRDVPADTAETDLLFRRWTTDKARFALIADTMDPDRFEAIARFVEAQIRAGERRQRLAIAMAQATARARPCA